MIRSKPSDLDKTKDLEEWRNKDPENTSKDESVRPSGRDARITKNVRMRLRFSEMLRDEAFNRSKKSGKRVSEADLVDEALSEWQRNHNIPAE